MAKTLAYLRAQTRTYLDEAVQADWKDAEVDREINNGYHRVVAAVMTTYEDFYIDTSTFNTIADQQEYGVADGLPDDLFKIRRLEVNYSPEQVNSKRVRVKSTTIDHVASNLENTSGGVTPFNAPVYYLIGGAGTDYKVGLIPVPKASGPDTQAQENAKLWYVKEVADLIDSIDQVLIPYPDRYAQVISRYAASVLLSKGQQEEKAAIAYMEIFSRDLALMQQQLEERVSDDVPTVVDTAGEDVDFGSGGWM
jgi:hypothetical protein